MLHIRHQFQKVDNLDIKQAGYDALSEPTTILNMALCMANKSQGRDARDVRLRLCCAATI